MPAIGDGTNVGRNVGRSLARLGRDKYKAERMILGAAKENLHTVSKEARNVVVQAYLRERGALSSIGFFIKSDAMLESSLKMRSNDSMTSSRSFWPRLRTSMLHAVRKKGANPNRPI